MLVSLYRSSGEVISCLRLGQFLPLTHSPHPHLSNGEYRFGDFRDLLLRVTDHQEREETFEHEERCNIVAAKGPRNQLRKIVVQPG